MSAFRQRYPAAELELAEYTFSDPSAGLNSGQVDIAFIMPPISHNGLSIQEIYHVPRVAVISAGHRLASRATISVHELFDDPWIVAETSDTVCRDFWLATGHRAGQRAKLGQTTKSIDKFIQLAIAGQVVGLAAAWVEDTFGRPGIRFTPVVDIGPAVTAIAWHPSSLTPLASASSRSPPTVAPCRPGPHHDHGTIHVQVLTQKALSRHIRHDRADQSADTRAR